MTTSEIILIISAIASPILAIWNSLQGLRIKELEYKYDNLCSTCEFNYSPKSNDSIDKNNLSSKPLA